MIARKVVYLSSYLAELLEVVLNHMAQSFHWLDADKNEDRNADNNEDRNADKHEAKVDCQDLRTFWMGSGGSWRSQEEAPVMKTIPCNFSGYDRRRDRCSSIQREEDERDFYRYSNKRVRTSGAHNDQSWQRVSMINPL